jgi:hypothetical protein
MWRRFWDGLGKCWSGSGVSPRRGRTRPAPARRRLTVEALEERQVLSATKITAMVPVQSFDLLGLQGVLTSPTGLIDHSQRISELLKGVRVGDKITVRWDYALTSAGQAAVAFTIVPDPRGGAGKSHAILGRGVSPDGADTLPGLQPHEDTFDLASRKQVIIALATDKVESDPLTISYEPEATPPVPHPAPHPHRHGHKHHLIRL